MKTSHLIISTLLLAALSLAACGIVGPQATPTATLTSTPDVCAPANLKIGAVKVHEFMRAFDDAYQLAASLPRSQLAPQVSKLQDIRRLAQDQAVPTCLVQLKKLQLLHMDTAINTFLAFLGGADQNTVNQGIALARQQHDAYTLELARLLGLTVIAPPSVTPGAQVPAPAATQTAPPAGLSVTNPGPNPINLRASASLTSQTVGALQPGQSARALGRSQTGEWILIENPSQVGKSAWVYTTLVKLSGDPAALPVTTPSP
jgi:predicted small lipoprotein YifL